ncbi:MAG: hypothetical protein DSY33_02210 [Archaeoglobus sp.]|nr:MAG: hypothetical protein DSY33_02210 [Archaeoglobus sp.]
MKLDGLVRFNTVFRKFMTLWVFLSIFFGLVFGYYFPEVKLSCLVLPLVFLMIYVMIVPTRFSLFINVFRSPREIILGLINILVIAPLIAFAISSLFIREHSTIAGFTLAGAVPPGGMNAAWTGLLGGNVPLAIVLQALTLVISVVQVPYTLQFFVGTYVKIPVTLLMRSLAVLVFLPLTAGFITRYCILRAAGEDVIDKMRPLFPVLSGMCALGVVFVASSLQAVKIISNPSAISYLILVAVIYYAVLFIAGTIISRFAGLNYVNSIPVIYGGATKNLSIAIALALSAFHNPCVVLSIIACFMVQMPMASVFFKIVPKILK